MFDFIRIDRRCIKIVAAAIILLSSPFSLRESMGYCSDADWSVFIYGGRWSDNDIGEILRFDSNTQQSYVWVAGVSRKIHDITDHLLLEFEFNTAKHTGKQTHFEINSAVNLRWHSFPWNDLVETSLAFGLGPSYAFAHPEIENTDGRTTSRTHVFMPVELTLAPPRQNDGTWEFLLRIHHRSGAFGVVNNTKGSNFITTGIRFRY